MQFFAKTSDKLNLKWCQIRLRGEGIDVPHVESYCGGGCAICDCIMPQVRAHVFKSLMHTLGVFFPYCFYPYNA